MVHVSVFLWLMVLSTCLLAIHGQQDGDEQQIDDELNDNFDSLNDFMDMNSTEIENAHDTLMSYKRKLLNEIDPIIEKTITESKCNRQTLLDLRETIKYYFEKIDQLLDNQAKKNTESLKSEDPTTDRATSTAPTPTTSTPTTTTTTANPIRMCGENMENRCVQRWNCKNQIQKEDKFLINLQEESDCHYLETCCNSADIMNVTFPNFSNVEKRCGFTNPKGIYMTIVGNDRGESQFGQFPWMVAIFNKWNKYVVGGALIAPKVVLSTASNLNRVDQFKVRAGEWDKVTDNEILPYQERKARVIMHENFSFETFSDNVALLFLNATFHSALHIRPICLPESFASFTSFNYEKCFIAGWNRYPINGKSILRSVGLSMIDCDDETPESLLCVRGSDQYLEYSVGSPLVCPKMNESNNQYYQIGTWSHNYNNNHIFFTNITRLTTWIEAEKETSSNYQF